MFARLIRAIPVLLALAGAPLLCLASQNASAAKTLVVLGDSIAAGYGVEPDEAFPALLQKRIDDAGVDYRVVNAGVSGDTTAGGLRRINWLLRQRVDLLLLELGGNDGLRGIQTSETKRNLKGIITRTKEKYPHAQILIAGMQMPNNMGEEYAHSYKEIFREVAEEDDAVLIPFLLEGVGGKADLNQADRIHPTPEGHRIVAENVWKLLGPLLQKDRTAAK